MSGAAATERPTLPPRPIALIVEDEADLARFMAVALEKAGYGVVLAENGEAALTWLRGVLPKLVVLDLSLPDLPGTDVLSHIRLDPRLARIKVMVVSADVQRAESLRGKADLVLIKPVSYTQLRELAARLLAGDSGEGHGDARD